VTALHRAKAERYPRDSFSRLLAGWSGAFMTAEIGTAKRTLEVGRHRLEGARCQGDPAEIIGPHIARVFRVEVPPL
jgi:hypothetical protein